MVAWIALVVALFVLGLNALVLVGVVCAYRKLRPAVSPFLAMMTPHVAPASSSPVGVPQEPNRDPYRMERD